MPAIVRFYRLLVICGIAWLLKAPPPPDPSVPIGQFFPDAAEHNTKTHEVSDSEGRLLGFLLTTLPETEHLRGYSGPANIALILDPAGRITKLQLLHSPDTEDHLHSVIKDQEFWQAHLGLKLGSPGNPEVDAVSGSTLTSIAISRSIVERLGGQTSSRLFPTDILLAEFATLLPGAHRLEDHPDWPGTKIIYNQDHKIIGHALRTAPLFEYLKGFQGPTDVLILLDKKAEIVKGLRFRKSYDNEDYYERILDDEDYLQLYNGKTIAEIIASEKNSEGVSGATDTSWAIAEGVRRRLARFEDDRRPKPFSIPWRNAGLVLLTLGSAIFTFTRLRGNPKARVIWQIAVVLTLGLLWGDLLSQALFLGWAKHGLPWQESWGLICLAAAALFIPWATGKQFYCHHLCPHGFLQQWLGKLPVKPIKPPRLLSQLPSILLIVIGILAITATGINYADFEAFDAWLWQAAGFATITIAILGLLASIFVPMAYCKYGCPTGALFKFLRHTSSGNQFGLRDLISGALLIVAFYFS
ncbi:MAG: FMN-binding protein [Akkermansiaceae bacterium]